jgi:hypothetical protein
MKTNSEKKIEILYDHYKETFLYQREYIKDRDIYFIISLSLLIFLVLQLTNEQLLQNVVNSLTKTHIDKDIKIDFSYVDNILNTIFFYVMIKYYQLNTLIERMYDYIHNCEKDFQKVFRINIAREGKAYKENYPLILQKIHIVYTIVYPIILAVVITIKIKLSLYTLIVKIQYYVIFDMILFLLLFVINLVYMYWLNSKLINLMLNKLKLFLVR